MTAKIVCRLLDDTNTLLGWVEHHAVARGDGCLRSVGPVSLVVDVSGFPTHVSLHWCEVNVETRVPSPAIAVRPGDVVRIFEDDTPMVTLGEPAVGLPAVTVGRPVSIAVPMGTIGARG